jgi:hypothetical protein
MVSSFCFAVFAMVNVNFHPTGKLHLHPISEVHQFRPSMTYMDVLSRRAAAISRRRAMGAAGADSDSESDGPPPDPDEPAPPPKEKEKGKKKESGSALPAREVQVTTRRAEDKSGGMTFPGGLSGVRREMLMQMRAESDDKWENLKWFDAEVRFFSDKCFLWTQCQHGRQMNRLKSSNPSFRIPLWVSTNRLSVKADSLIASIILKDFERSTTAFYWKSGCQRWTNDYSVLIQGRPSRTSPYKNGQHAVW